MGESPDVAASQPRRRGAPGLLRDVRVAWAVALLALLAAGFMALQWQSLRAEAIARDEAREAGEVIAARVTTFDGATIDEFVTKVRRRATGSYAEQVTELFDQDFRAALREGEVRSVGEVLRSFVQHLDGDDAELFVLVRQTSINAARDEPVEDELRMELTLQRVDDEWLAADIAVLGPGMPGLPLAPTREDDEGP